MVGHSHWAIISTTTEKSLSAGYSWYVCMEGVCEYIQLTQLKSSCSFPQAQHSPAFPAPLTSTSKVALNVRDNFQSLRYVGGYMSERVHCDCICVCVCVCNAQCCPCNDLCVYIMSLYYVIEERSSIPLQLVFLEVPGLSEILCVDPVWLLLPHASTSHLFYRALGSSYPAGILVEPGGPRSCMATGELPLGGLKLDCGPKDQ